MKKILTILPFKKLVFIAFFICLNLGAQSSYRFGSIPSINLNTQFSNSWGFNFKSEFRYLFRSGLKGVRPQLENEYLQTDVTFLTNKTVGLGNKIVMGFMARIREDRLVQRYIQQYVLVRKYDGYRIGYRFALDETFDDITTVRLRFRTSTEIPLNGKNVDENEMYIKFNNELLNNFEKDNFDLEFRMIPFLGYKLKDNNKIEVGLDYRLDSFLNEQPRHTAWVSVNWYLKI